MHATMAKKVTRKPFRRRFGKGKFSTKSRRRIGRPSRGLTKSIYMHSTKIVTGVRDISAIPAVPLEPNPRWSNNGPTITGAMHKGIFRLEDIPDLARYQAMYSAYRINAVKVEFILTGNISIAAPTGGTSFNLNCYTFYDPSGNWAGAFPTEDECLAMQSCKRQLTTQAKPYKAYSKMKQANESLGRVGLAVNTTVYTQMKPKFISTDTPNVNHYGLMSVFYSSGDGMLLPSMPIRAITTYYLEFKGVR